MGQGRGLGDDCWISRLVSCKIVPLTRTSMRGQFFFFNFLFCIGVELINNECCDSFRWIAKGLSHKYACTHSPQTPLPSKLPHYIKQSSICYTVGPCWYSSVYIHPKHPNYPFLLAFPLGNHKFISKSVSFFLSCVGHIYYFFLYSTYKGYHMIFLLLCLTSSLSRTISRSIHGAANGIISFLFMAE